MSWIFKRRDVQVAIVVITFLCQFLPYIFDIPPLLWFSTKLVTIVSLIASFTIILGLNSAIRRSYNIIRERKRIWILQVYMLILLGLMVVFGLGLGMDSSAFKWLMLAIVDPLSSVNYSILTFYMASAAARAFRARSPQASILLVTGVIVLLQQAPLTATVFPQIDIVSRFFNDAFNLAIARMFLMAVSVGAIVLGVRVLTGKEIGFLGLGEGE